MTCTVQRSDLLPLILSDICSYPGIPRACPPPQACPLPHEPRHPCAQLTTQVGLQSAAVEAREVADLGRQRGAIGAGSRGQGDAPGPHSHKADQHGGQGSRDKQECEEGGTGIEASP